MRGTLHGFGNRAKLIGITPAYAGNTEILMPKVLVCRDHPRVCGEHGSLWAITNPTLGSPPRMRGTQRDEILFGFGVGITPAYAGNTP